MFNKLTIEIYEKYNYYIRLYNICISIGQNNMNSFDVQFITHLINFYSKSGNINKAYNNIFK